MIGQRPHTKGLRCIVPGIDQINPKFFRQGIGMVGPLTGHEGINPLSRHRRHFTPGASRDDTNLTRSFGTTGRQVGALTEDLLQTIEQAFTSFFGKRRPASKLNPFPGKEGLGFFQSKCLGQEHVVPIDLVNIEWQVDTEDGQVVLHGHLELLIIGTLDRLDARPEHAVMNDKEIDLILHRAFDDRQARIDGGTHFPHVAIVRQLETVVRRRIIGNLINSKQFLQIVSDASEFRHVLTLGASAILARREPIGRRVAYLATTRQGVPMDAILRFFGMSAAILGSIVGSGLAWMAFQAPSAVLWQGMAIMCFGGAAAGAVTWFLSHRKIERDIAQRQQQQMIAAAQRRLGRVTDVELVAETRYSLDECRAFLKEMTDSGSAEMQIGKEGTVVYVFPGFLTEAEKRHAQPATQWTPPQRSIRRKPSSDSPPPLEDTSRQAEVES